MLSKSKLCVNRTSKELFKDFTRRHISKTSSTPNSDAISRQQSKELNLSLNTNNENACSRWLFTNRQNNIRALSTIQTKAKTPQNSFTVVSKEESREFMSYFPDIVRDLTEAGRHTDIPEVTRRYSKVLQYNVPNGKKNRGLFTVAAYKILEKPENLTPENVKLANILGWCTEMKAFAAGVIRVHLVPGIGPRQITYTKLRRFVSHTGDLFRLVHWVVTEH